MSLRLAPGADAALRDIVNQLNQRFALAENPVAPLPLFTVADVASLPDAVRFRGCVLFCEDVGSATPGLAYSDGADWRRVDTNATL